MEYLLSVVYNEEQPDAALGAFMKLLTPVTNKHAPVKKMTVKTVKSPWIDEELKKCMVAPHYTPQKHKYSLHHQHKNHYKTY